MTPQPKGYGPYPYRLHGDSSKNQLKLDDEYQQDAASSGMKDDGKFVVQQIYDMDDDDESDGQSDSGEFPSISLAANIEQHISRPKRTKEATENDTASQPHFCRYVRIRKHTSSSKVYFKIIEVQIESFFSTLAMSKDRSSASHWSWTSHILIFPGDGSGDPLPFRFSKTIRRSLRKQWNISNMFFNAHWELPSGILSYAPVPLDDSWKGYLIRNDQSITPSGTLAISHDMRSAMTYSVLTAWTEDAFPILINRLEKLKQYAGSPLSLPIAMLDIHIGWNVDFIGRRAKGLAEIQVAMNTVHYATVGWVKDEGEVDLVVYMSKLTSLVSACALASQAYSSQERIFQFLWQQIQTLKAEENYVIWVILGEHLVFMNERLEAQRRNNNSIQTGAQAQVQMVFSLLSQRDNEQNLKLAQLAQKQNNLNIQISKFAAYESRLSNKMAKSSLAYGADMQVIAAVTLAFLPGTFIATFFSTSFWNFQPGNHGGVVSKWIWLYCVVTAGVTAAVMIAWRYVSKSRTDGLELPPELDLGGLSVIELGGRAAEEKVTDV